MIKKTRDKKYYAPQNAGNSRPCDHEGCNKKGEYRAPKDKNLKDYFWFCLEHVQEYNQSWNYYNGIEEEDVEEEVYSSQKPFSNFSSKIRYNYGIYDDYSSPEGIYWTSLEKKYIAIMELSPKGLSIDLLRQQYKKLVKKYHPDVNAGDKEKEEKFKFISVAYNCILKRLEKA